MAVSERDPLLAPTPGQSLLLPSLPTQIRDRAPRRALYWTLAGLWTAVFLGAMDGYRALF